VAAILQLLDQLIAMARLLGQQGQQDQLQVARSKPPAEPETTAALMAGAAMPAASPPAEKPTELMVVRPAPRTVIMTTMAVPASSIFVIFNMNSHFRPSFTSLDIS
jgi:hypothetical protein